MVHCSRRFSQRIDKSDHVMYKPILTVMEGYTATEQSSARAVKGNRPARRWRCEYAKHAVSPEERVAVI